MMQKKAINECNLFFFDCETGGLDPNVASMIEVACVVTDPTGENVIHEYCAKVKPLKPVHPIAAAMGRAAAAQAVMHQRRTRRPRWSELLRSRRLLVPAVQRQRARPAVLAVPQTSVDTPPRLAVQAASVQMVAKAREEPAGSALEAILTWQENRVVWAIRRWQTNKVTVVPRLAAVTAALEEIRPRVMAQWVVPAVAVAVAPVVRQEAAVLVA
jgi:hypothetical protein